MDQDGSFEFEFEKDLQNDFRDERAREPPQLPQGEIGQQPRNFVKNYKKTVCAFWIKGMCMKGDACGFLHEMVPERMPECQVFLKKGYCPDPDCVFKHTRENIKECNMYALGFCIYGPDCRYNHTRKPGPPPDPSTVEAAKPKIFRDINRVVNAVNSDVAGDGGAFKRQRTDNTKPLPLSQFPILARKQQRTTPNMSCPPASYGPPGPVATGGHVPRPPPGAPPPVAPPPGSMVPRPHPGVTQPARPAMYSSTVNHVPHPPTQPPPTGGMVPVTAFQPSTTGLYPGHPARAPPIPAPIIQQGMHAPPYQVPDGSRPHYVQY